MKTILAAAVLLASLPSTAIAGDDDFSNASNVTFGSLEKKDDLEYGTQRASNQSSINDATLTATQGTRVDSAGIRNQIKIQSQTARDGSSISNANVDLTNAQVGALESRQDIDVRSQKAEGGSSISNGDIAISNSRVSDVDYRFDLKANRQEATGGSSIRTGGIKIGK